MRKVLLLLGQMPHDPTSGAARSMRTICEMLASRGFTVQSLATTSNESGEKLPALDVLRGLGIQVKVDRRAALGKGRPVFRFKSNGIEHAMLDVGSGLPRAWRESHGRQFDRLFQETLKRFRPDVVFTYGGFPDDVARRRVVRQAGGILVFGLHNMKYMNADGFGDVDAVLSPSHYVSDTYERRIGLVSTPLPTPLLLDETLAADPRPTHYTYVNPSRAKGMYFFATLAERVATERPDLPLLVVQARGTSDSLVEIGRAAGFDLRRHASLTFASSMPYPRDIFQTTRVLLAPSVIDEAAGRVAAEALVNGIPAIVSDRGGLPETVAGGGFVEAIPTEITMDTRTAVSADAVAGWYDRITMIADDAAGYPALCTRARTAGAVYQEETLASRFVEYFRSVKQNASVIRTNRA